MADLILYGIVMANYLMEWKHGNGRKRNGGWDGSSDGTEAKQALHELQAQEELHTGADSGGMTGSGWIAGTGGITGAGGMEKWLALESQAQEGGSGSSRQALEEWQAVQASEEWQELEERQASEEWHASEELQAPEDTGIAGTGSIAGT